MNIRALSHEFLTREDCPDDNLSDDLIDIGRELAHAVLKDRSKFETYTRTVGQAHANLIVSELLTWSCWFTVTPLSDDTCEITVKSENETRLRGLY